MSNDIDTLAQHYGLGDAYYDYRGEFRRFSDAARRAILERMGCDVDGYHDDHGNRKGSSHGSGLNDQQGDQQSATSAADIWLESVSVCEYAHVKVPLRLPATTQFIWKLMLESGEVCGGAGTPDSLHLADGRYWLPLADVPCGYHTLRIEVNAHVQDARLIVTPVQCYEPIEVAQGQRQWGLSIQLYTLRSARNWGMGDFADLRELARNAAQHGCALIGLNPLHALRPADATHISPYSPSSRSLLNVLYIAVDALPDFSTCQPLQQWLVERQPQLQALRDSHVVQYSQVAMLKLAALRMLHTQLRQDAGRTSVFRAFIDKGGEALRRHALFDALDTHFCQYPAHRWGWQSWPVEYQMPTSQAVQEFATAHANEVEFFMYLQWLAATQWQEAQQVALMAGMSLGLYGDVAVGVDPGGAEIWSNRELYVEGVAVGAPPDPLALKGQDWGIPPQHPLRLKQQCYEPFVQMLRANMQSCGALRIDHVMTLCRLWWVPRGFEATEGVYVHYPLDDLVRIVALESQRNRCVVIGEDLGTVPDAMRHAMARHALYHYKVLFFEKAQDGEFIAPEHYPHHGLAVVTTHDLPPFRSWWESADIDLRKRLALYPDAAIQEQVQRERHTDRCALMRALSRCALWYWQDNEPLPPYSFELMRATYLYAGLSQSALLVVQPEDLLGMTDPVNVPGTSAEHANWQRKLSDDLGEVLQRPRVVEFMQALGKARNGLSPNK